MIRPKPIQIILACMTLTFSGIAQAESRWGVQLAAGSGNRWQIKEADLGIVWDPEWSGWRLGAWRFTMVVEGHLAVWHTDQADVNGNVIETGITPVFRFICDSGVMRPFIEAGIGVRAISHPRIATDYTLTTAFQFADMVGIGAQFGAHQQYQAGFRFQHISNGGIKHPNPGINFVQGYVQYNY